jgi:hypothetical protein
LAEGQGIGFYTLGLMAGSTFQQAAGSWELKQLHRLIQPVQLHGHQRQRIRAVRRGALCRDNGSDDLSGAVLRRRTDPLQRYYEKSYDYATAIGASIPNFIEQYVVSGIGNYQTNSVFYKVRKRAVPTLSIYPSNGGAVGNVYAQGAAAAKTANTDSTSESHFALFISLTAADLIRFSYVADARL